MNDCLSEKLKCLLAGALIVVSTQAGAAVTDTNRLDYVEGDVLVRFRATETADSANRVATLHGIELKRHFAHLSKSEGRVISLLHSTKTTTALLAELRADPAVESVEPNYLRYPTSLRPPNDPRFGIQWSFQNTGQFVNASSGTTNVDIGFLRAWGLARPATNEIVVGVIDTGLDIKHPDIVSNLWTNPGENAANNLDDDANGYVNDVHGYDFALHTGALTDSGDHGTHVAGTVAATGNNGLGVIGVDFQARMEEVIPWPKLLAVIAPFYPKGERGRPPVGLERMLRVYFLQQWYGLADEALEDALYDSQALRGFARIDLAAEGAPDATTLLKFRRLLETHDLCKGPLCRHQRRSHCARLVAARRHAGGRHTDRRTALHQEQGKET